MKALAGNEIRGTWATLILPWNDDDTLDEGRLADEINVILESGVDGVYAHGTAGEFHTINKHEFDTISEMLAVRCEAAKMPFQIGVSHTNAHISYERLKRAVDLKPSAMQVILPDWYPVTNDEAVAFLRVMAEAANGIGLVLYNPPHAKRELHPDEIGLLASEVPQLVGVKVSGRDEDWYIDFRKHAPDLSLFVAGHNLATGYRWGANGSYSNVACLNPRAAGEWYRMMSDDIHSALELEKRIQKFMNENIVPFITEQSYSPGACDRLLALIGGWADVGEKLRWPYRAIPGSEAERLRPIAEELLPEFF